MGSRVWVWTTVLALVLESGCAQRRTETTETVYEGRTTGETLQRGGWCRRSIPRCASWAAPGVGRFATPGWTPIHYLHPWAHRGGGVSMRSKHGQEHGIRGVLASGWAEVGLVLLTTLVAMALLLPGCDRPKQPQVGAPPAEVVVLDPSDIDEFRADALRRLDALGAQLAAARERIAEAPVDRRLDVDAELAALEQRHESLRVQLVELESTTPEDERGAARTRVETGIDQLELEVEHAVGQLKGTGA